MAPVTWSCESPGCKKKVTEEEPHLAVQLLQLHGVQVHGLPSRQGSAKVMATTASTPLTAPSMDTCSENASCSNKRCGATGVITSQTLQPGLPNKALASKDISSSKQSKSKGIKKGEVSQASLEMGDNSSASTLLNFGRLLTL